MKLPPADLVYVAQRLQQVGRELVETWEDAGAPRDCPAPPELLHAMEQLFDVLHPLRAPASSAGNPEREKELKTLGEHGLQLLAELARQAQSLGLGPQARALRDLCFPFALWIARNGGEFTTIEPVADAVAELANRLSEPEALGELYCLIDELLEAAAPPIGRSREGRPPLPWRILVLNRAIVATRSHRPALMEEAFVTVAELLPEEAPGFFEEAMEQMDVVGYPEPVRAVVERHYREHCGGRILH
jgi:hypothetical protein